MGLAINAWANPAPTRRPLPPSAVMAGLGELSRLNRLITPEFGPMVRVFTLLTDLPVALDKPIDADHGVLQAMQEVRRGLPLRVLEL